MAISDAHKERLADEWRNSIAKTTAYQRQCFPIIQLQCLAHGIEDRPLAQYLLNERLGHFYTGFRVLIDKFSMNRFHTGAVASVSPNQNIY